MLCDLCGGTHKTQKHKLNSIIVYIQIEINRVYVRINIVKEAYSATMIIFDFFYFLFKSFVKVELSYVFTINLFTIAKNCTEK